MPEKRGKKNPLSAINETKYRAIVACENGVALLKHFKKIADHYRNRAPNDGGSRISPPTRNHGFGNPLTPVNPSSEPWVRETAS